MTLLGPEEISSKGKAQPEEVVAAYSRAIGAMEETGWANMEGLANEKVGFYLVRVGELDRASAYFDRALYLYRYEWGALAKYEWLLEQSQEVIGRKRASECSLPMQAGVVGSIIDVDSSCVASLYSST